MDKHIVTIDGPTAAGTSSNGKRLVFLLDRPNSQWQFFSAGEFYRAGTAYAMRNKLNPEQLGKKAHNLEFQILEDGIGLGDMKIKNEKLNGKTISENVFNYAQNVPFREIVENSIKKAILSADGNFVVEGRNMGYELFRNEAILRAYLTANLNERITRRKIQWNNKNGIPSIARLLVEKDSKDYLREVSPLIIPEVVEWDCTHNNSENYGYDKFIDTTNKNANQVSQELYDAIKTKINNK